MPGALPKAGKSNPFLEAAGTVPFVREEGEPIDYGAIRSLSIKVPGDVPWKQLDPFNPPAFEAAE